MRRISFRIIIGAAALLAVAAGALATPTPNSAVIIERVFNDCPGSTLTTSNTYPGQIIIDDVNTPGCVGFANLHVWRFSEDGSSAAIFSNCDAFRFCADLLLTGTGEGEGGLQIRPWWDEAGGRINVRTTDGEIACFGGRLPFYSFTANNGLHYVKGTTIHLEMIYLPPVPCVRPFPLNTIPGTIEYKLTYNATNYSSGVLNFDQGNAGEDPPHSLWGILDPAQAGGHDQFFVGQSGLDKNFRAEWDEICFEKLLVAVEDKAWGMIKGLYR